MFATTHKINSARRDLQPNNLKNVHKNMEEKKLNFFAWWGRGLFIFTIQTRWRALNCAWAENKVLKYVSELTDSPIGNHTSVAFKYPDSFAKQSKYPDSFAKQSKYHESFSKHSKYPEPHQRRFQVPWQLC